MTSRHVEVVMRWVVHLLSQHLFSVRVKESKMYHLNSVPFLSDRVHAPELRRRSIWEITGRHSEAEDHLFLLNDVAFSVLRCNFCNLQSSISKAYSSKQRYSCLCIETTSGSLDFRLSAHDIHVPIIPGSLRHFQPDIRSDEAMMIS